MPRVFVLVSAIHKKIPTFIEIIAFVTANGLFVRCDRRCGDRVVVLGRCVCAREAAAGAAAGTPLERGSGGGTEGGGKLTCLVWQFLGVASVCQIPLNRLTKAVFEIGVGMPTKFSFRSGGIYSAARLTIGSG